ncbi:MAG: glutathione S-transferase N-terminal domain-containing protein [Candidatus Omnitrophica bacterium]|nr:glutathione S-transferase N-terminal domain-containing protein [Candidatus Omnitrophota bacterium]
MAKKVTVYSTPTCPFCIRAKQFLKDNNIQYSDVDVSSDQTKAQEMIDRSGQMGVPVIDVDGTIVVGFDKDKIREALKLPTDG